jgi:hypothetical protein
LADPSASEPVEKPGQERPSFPSYEELSADLIEALDHTGLFIEDVRHHVEPSVGERRFECTVRLSSSEPPSRYHVHLSFVWDALLTYVAAYGAGADCDLYHDDDDAEDCPHHQLTPQPFVEVEAEFVLGDGGYELHDVAEVASWVDTVQELLSKVFGEEDRPSVHLGMASLGGTTLVEKFTAEHSWLLDFERAPDFEAIARQVQGALRTVPQLADRLPI